MKGQETTEKNRPPLKPPKETKEKMQKKVQEKQLESSNGDLAVDDSETRQEASAEEGATRNNRYIEMPESPSSLRTVQNQRLTVECVECRKSRVVYSK